MPLVFFSEWFSIAWAQSTPYPSSSPDALYYGWQAAPPASSTPPALVQGSTSDGSADGAMNGSIVGDRVIADIQVQFVDDEGTPTEGRTRPYVITREFAQQQPGNIYDVTLAQQGLDRVSGLSGVRQADLVLEPTTDPNQVVMVVNVVEQSLVALRPGAVTRTVSTLQGPFQRHAVLGVGPSEVPGLSTSGEARLRHIGGNDQDLVLRIRGGEQVLDGELSYIDPWIGNDPQQTGYAMNIFNQRSIQGTFTGGDRDVDLPNGLTPWVHRIGGGVGFFRPVTPELTAAVGVNYQQVTVRNAAFSSVVHSEDELNEPVTVSENGFDDLLTLNLLADYDRRNDPEEPTAGSRAIFGIDQAIPVGNANIGFTRFSGQYLHYLPVSLFGFAEGPRTLIFNVQAGTMLGDVPPYEAFNLDSGPVRGYGGTEVGTGSSFALVGTEYRFPIANFSIAERPIQLGGALFGGYVTDLGTADEVIGQPAVTREKTGDAFGYGIGLRARTPMGLFRVEFGLDSQGESEFVFGVGEQF